MIGGVHCWIVTILLLVIYCGAVDAAFGRPYPALRVWKNSCRRVPVAFVQSQDDGGPSGGVLPCCEYFAVPVSTTNELGRPPKQAVSVHDLTPILRQLLLDTGMHSGTVTVMSRHTTTAITINERESRLARDMADIFTRLIPPDERSVAAAATLSQPSSLQHPTRYQHNDIDLRPESDEEAERCRENGWDIDDPVVLQTWRDQEPINAHSHLISMLLGSTESIPVVQGKMMIGQWQSVLMVDLDGPRDRTVGVHLMGYKNA